MEAWIECGGQFIRADVVRWTEAVFENKTRGRKPLFLGEREVIAEVQSEPDAKGFLNLLVRGCKVVSVSKKANAPSPPVLDNATEIRRQKKTLLRNGVQRLAWDDEGARGLVASRFLNEAEAPPTKPEPKNPPRFASKSKRRSRKRT